MPTSLTRAACVSCIPFSEGSKFSCESSTMKAVQLHISSVSTKTPRACISPCLTGCETSAVAAALGAEPIPASLENSPLRIPCISAIPTAPAAASCHPIALFTMSIISCGIFSKFSITTVSARRMYAMAINGTSTPDTFAIRLTPPNITIAVSAVIATPLHTGAMSKESLKARAMVFD